MASSPSNGPDQLVVRPAAPEDAKIIWLWRNDPTTRASSRTAGVIPWEEHVDWYSAVLSDPDRIAFMVMSATASDIDTADPIAVVRFDRLAATTAHWLVNLNLRPESRGKGLGRHILFAACRAFFDAQGVQTLQAEIHPQNAASKRVFSGVGFKLASRPKAAGFELFTRPAVPLPKVYGLGSR